MAALASYVEVGGAELMAATVMGGGAPAEDAAPTEDQRDEADVLFLRRTIKYLRCATSGAAGNGLGTTIKFLRSTAGIGLGTKI
jgi:hypothetical protein